jgi:hypothetical protein
MCVKSRLNLVGETVTVKFLTPGRAYAKENPLLHKSTNTELISVRVYIWTRYLRNLIGQLILTSPI